MKKTGNKCRTIEHERECNIKGICGIETPSYSFREITLFGLDVLSKTNQQNNNVDNQRT